MFKQRLVHITIQASERKKETNKQKAKFESDVVLFGTGESLIQF